ncbi:MAG TPA: ABC transporter permease [Actinomycetota bacterium]|nr:ABC transporter permease [Actinomycetota bacterium]
MQPLPVRHVTADSSLWSDIREKGRALAASGDVIINLIRKELKVRYRNSSLGFVWSMLNPLLYLAVFYLVFEIFLPSSVPHYHVYLLSGLLPWSFFAISLTHATVSVTSNHDLVKKVDFAREVLPVSAIGAGLINFLLQLCVFFAFLLMTRYDFVTANLLLVPIALLAQLSLMLGLGFLLSAANVKARDAQHFLDLALLGAFWMVPIVYPSSLVAAELSRYEIGGIPAVDIYLLNPVTRIVLAFQRGIYGNPAGETPTGVLIEDSVSWHITSVGYALLVGLLLLAAGWYAFHRSDRYFAEEL